MNVLSTLKNPVVLGGGALLGVVLLMRSSGANAAVASTADAINPTVVSATMQYNTAALGAEVQKAQAAYQYGATVYALNVQDHANVLSYMKNLDDNATMVENSRINADAGVTNALIASNTAMVVDFSNNAERLGEAYQQTAQAQIKADADVSVAKYQYKAQKAAAKSSLIGTIVGSVAKVATAGLTGGFPI